MMQPGQQRPMAYPSGDTNASGYPLTTADGKASDAVAHSGGMGAGGGDSAQLTKDLNMYKGLACCNCFWCMVILVIDCLLIAGLALMLQHTTHQMLLSVNWPLYPDTTLEGAIVFSGNDYEDAFERLTKYQPNGIAAYHLMHEKDWNMYLDVYGELEVEVDDADRYAERLTALAARMQSDLREERALYCVDPIYCGGEFGAQKCELNPNLNPLIETSGDTLTIGFNAEGLFPAKMLGEVSTCSSYDVETGACGAATTAISEPRETTILKELLAAMYLGCDGDDFRMDMTFLAGPSWREIVDSTDHWLEHFKEGFAWFMDVCPCTDGMNAMLDKMIEVETREDGTTELTEKNFPREVFNITMAEWMTLSLGSGDIDDIIDDWPSLIPVDGWDDERVQASGVFSEDFLQVWHWNYAYLRDYRSPYADIHELWEGDEEDMLDANEAMRTAQMWADIIQDMDEDGEFELTLVSSAAELPWAILLEVESEGIQDIASIFYKTTYYRDAENEVQRAYHDATYPSTASDYYYTVETYERSFADTYAEYEYRCGAGSTDYLWGSSQGSGEEVDEALRLDNKACYTRFECFDDAEGYYYDEHNLDCGFAEAREWVGAYAQYPNNAGRCIKAGYCGDSGSFAFGWWECDDRNQFDVFGFMDITWSDSDAELLVA